MICAHEFALKMHQSKKHAIDASGKVFRCKYRGCSYTADRNYILVAHVSRVHLKSSKSYMCENCLEEFNLFRQWKCHTCMSQENKPVTFNIAESDNCISHGASNDDDDGDLGDAIDNEEDSNLRNALECQTCHKSFSNSSALNSHKCKFSIVKKKQQKASKKENVLVDKNALYGRDCMYCFQRFSNKDTLLAHIHKSHPTQASKCYKCEVCLLHFDKKSILPDHLMRVHCVRFSLHCPICGKGCLFEHELKSHLKKFHASQIQALSENSISELFLLYMFLCIIQILSTR